jgi:hypothetical protein
VRAGPQSCCQRAGLQLQLLLLALQLLQVSALLQQLCLQAGRILLLLPLKRAAAASAAASPWQGGSQPLLLRQQALQPAGSLLRTHCSCCRRLLLGIHCSREMLLLSGNRGLQRSH